MSLSSVPSFPARVHMRLCRQPVAVTTQRPPNAQSPALAGPLAPQNVLAQAKSNQADPHACGRSQRGSLAQQVKQGMSMWAQTRVKPRRTYRCPHNPASLPSPEKHEPGPGVSPAVAAAQLWTVPLYPPLT